MLNSKDIYSRVIEGEARVVFKYPYDKRFIRACEAMQLRGLLSFGKDPIPFKGETYNAWYADIEKMDAEGYANYAMIVRDFYAADLRQKFDVLFKDVRHQEVVPSVHNPNTFMEAQREVVDKLIEKYSKTDSPLEFYGSKHQAEGVALFLSSLKNKHTKGVINADAQGMGKTRQAIIAAKEAGFKNILVIAPKTAKVATWPGEIRIVEKGASIFLADHKKYKERSQWTVLHWDALRLLKDEFFNFAKTFDLLIVDEFHRASNQDSQRSQALARISDEIPFIWGLTGTPVTKRPRNIINLLRLIKHPLVSTDGKVWDFLTHYCGDQDGYGQWNFDSAKNLGQLHELLRDSFIRREKDQTNLPDKVRVVKKVELNAVQRKAYDTAWADFLAKPGNADKAAKLGYPTEVVRRGAQRKSIAMVKVPLIVEWAEELIEAGEKVIIFTDFTDVFNAYMEHFKGHCVGINGYTHERDRAGIVDSFQKDPKVKVFIGNTKACSESITLTAASYLAFNDVTWIPIDQLQAEDRIHRGGAVKTCMIYYFLGVDTVDISGFQDFIAHKKVVENITNRRGEDGKVADTKWEGDTKGLGLEKSAEMRAKPAQIKPFFLRR